MAPWAGDQTLPTFKVSENVQTPGLARSAWSGATPKEPSRRVCVIREGVRNNSIIIGDEPFTDGSLGDVSQALRARLRSCRPCGTRWQTFRKAFSYSQFWNS
jgi:hypothetical protein